MVSINDKTYLLPDMDEELEEFHKRSEEDNNKKKLLIEFDTDEKNYQSPKFQLDKPKYKKKPKIRIFKNSNQDNTKGLF